MATFPSITPTYGVQKQSAPNVRTVRFGDGFEKRLSYGLNQNPKVYSLTFEVSETDADIIETFLDARADDNAAFDFTPPGESAGAKFVCFRHGTSPIPVLEPRHNSSNVPPSF